MRCTAAGRGSDRPRRNSQPKRLRGARAGAAGEYAPPRARNGHRAHRDGDPRLGGDRAVLLLSSSDRPTNPQSQAMIQRTDEARSFVTRRIAGEAIIVPVTNHVMNLECIFVVNDVGARIWELLETPNTTERIAAVLADEFAVTPERAQRDVEAFVTVLTGRRLVEAATAAADQAAPAWTR